MSFDKKDDELIRVVLRPVRGCATDSQYSDAYDRLMTAVTAIRQDERAAAFREMLSVVAVLPMRGTMNYRRGYEEGVRDALRTLEAAATSVKDSEGEGTENDV